MTTSSASLHAIITGGTITLDNVKSKSFAISIVDYLGDPLYCKINVFNSALNIFIDKDGPNALGPLAVKEAVQNVSVTVRYQTSIATWAGELPAPYTGTPLDFALKASSDLQFVSFAIGPHKKGFGNVAGPEAETPASATAATVTGEAHQGLPAAPVSARAFSAADPDPDAKFGFVAIEVEGQPGTVQLFFLDSGPTITNYRRLTKATIVPPANPPGSIGGPMGVALNS